MVKKPEILQHCLFNTGVRFTVTPDVKETTFAPGSVGFMSFVKEADHDYQNVAYITAVIVRRGKGGKARVNANGLSIPVFNDERMLKHDNYLPLGRRYYVHVEKMPLDEKHLLDLDDLSFVGWACAQAKYLNHLILNVTRPKAKKLWPGKNNNSPLVHAFNFPDYFDAEKDEVFEKYATKEFRSTFIEEARRMESYLAKCVLLHQKSIASILLNSAHFLTYTNEKYYEVADKKLAKNTVEFYEKKHKWLTKMSSVKAQVNKDGGNLWTKAEG